MWLLSVRAIGPRLSRTGAFACVVGVALVAWCGHGGPLSFTAIVFFVPVGVFAGLFLRVNTSFLARVRLCVALGWPFSPLLGGRRRGGRHAGECAGPFGVVDRRHADGSARRQGDVDPDTGLPNGFGLAERMRQAGAGSSFLVADVILAGVGDVREALGYAVGTELMRRVVEDIGQVLPPAAVIGRVAGDEFVVVQERRFELPEGAESSMADRDVPAPAIAEAEALALTLSRSIDHGRYLVGGIEVAVKAHIGLAIGPWHGGELAEMVRRASLSAVKGAAIGADRVIWHVGHHTLTSEDLVLLADLRLASERNELWVAYQPQISSRSRLPVSVEALLRWESPTHGRVAPGYFIPLAERSGLHRRPHRMGAHEVLNARSAGGRPRSSTRLRRDLSAKSLSQADLPEKILSRLEERRLPATSLALEASRDSSHPGHAQRHQPA